MLWIATFFFGFCFPDGGSELSSPKRRCEPCNDDRSSDLDGE